MSLDIYQQVFALSLASNLVSDVKGTQTSLQQALQSRLVPILKLIGADWQVVWGPVVWKHDPEDADTGPDNSWYIAYHPRLQYDGGRVHPTYVIAIAGTPRHSLYVWYYQDFTVNSVCDFNAWVASGIRNQPAVVSSANIVSGGTYIATGTADTTHLLLTTKAPEGATSAGKTLLDFISSVDTSASPKFIATGHSLGGALSPTLALALVKAGSIAAENTLTYPTAGPSPGNVEFTALFTKTLPPRMSGSTASYQGWNRNLVNTLDIVPQAWAPNAEVSQKQNLLNIPAIYGEPVLFGVVTTVMAAIIWSRSSGVTYMPLPSRYFTGPSPSATPATLGEFASMGSCQHVPVYIHEVGITIPTLTKPQVRGTGLVEKTREEKLYNYPLISDLEWAHEHPEEVRQIAESIRRNVETGYHSNADLQRLVTRIE